tara:strand:- start:764 stop:1312 length:549 start_codon:yes stop_codon:yes gene_type:complete
MAKTSGIVSIHGKDYATVPFRVRCFRELNPNGFIITTLEKDDGTVLVMKCCVYYSEFEMPIATGWAEEVRGSSNINKTSALENCETSAVGRALGFAGYGSAESIASAEEVTIAIERQKNQPKKKKEAKITAEQLTALGSYLDERSDGDVLLKKILDKHRIDHLKELSKSIAEQAISTWEIYA